jgi:hypothetical protein
MHDHHHHTVDASETASVVLRLGADTGALVLYVSAAELGREIEISRNGTGDRRTHAAVRERRLADHSVYGVVYDGLTAGEYTVWADETTPAGTATVNGAHVTEVLWDDLVRT